MKQLKHNEKRDSVILCCGSKRCPELFNAGDDKIRIRDDDGFIITISKEQARLIPQAIDMVDKNKADD
jgi:hypothetical protein